MLISAATGALPGTVHTVSPGDTIADTVDILAEYGIGAVVVTADGTSIDGIISERDVVRYLAREQEGTLRVRVEDLMTRIVTSCHVSDDVYEVMDVMLRGRFRHMPVVDDDHKLCGLVSLGDLVQAHLHA